MCGDDGWIKITKEHPLPDDLNEGDELRRDEIVMISTNYGGGRYGLGRKTWWQNAAYRRRSQE